jgi:hypothetical protein
MGSSRQGKWYVAEMVEVIRVEGESKNVVHRNFVLIRAGSAEEAYQKALDGGKKGDMTYENPQGQRVTASFQGLSNLTEIYTELEDGEEITYYQWVGLDEEEIQSMISSKEDLDVFRSWNEDDDDPDTPDIRARGFAEILSLQEESMPLEKEDEPDEIDPRDVLAEAERILRGGPRDSHDIGEDRH